MKQLILLLCLSTVAFSARSQRTLYSNSQTTDTVVNTATETWYAATNAQYSEYSVQIIVTKISGTVGGSLKLVYSNDGTNFFTFSGDATITPTDASGSYGWLVTHVSAPYIGVRWVGTGTMSASASATYNSRKTN